mgnify:FL=1
MKKDEKSKNTLEKAGKAITVIQIVWSVLGVIVGIVFICALIAIAKAVGVEIKGFFNLG